MTDRPNLILSPLHPPDLGDTPIILQPSSHPALKSLKTWRFFPHITSVFDAFEQTFCISLLRVCYTVSLDFGQVNSQINFFCEFNQNMHGKRMEKKYTFCLTCSSHLNGGGEGEGGGCRDPFRLLCAQSTHVSHCHT